MSEQNQDLTYIESERQRRERETEREREKEREERDRKERVVCGSDVAAEEGKSE